MNKESSKNERDNILERMSYDDFLERLKIEFGDFIRFAESGKTIRYQGLKSRKKSMKLRQLLKMFRPISIAQEKKINDVFHAAKENIKQM
ncbi:MAG: hypothetical protein GX638_01465 [Crenarchaeota archaeon]|nr:hypothetical protein [Thermoproteota archaeon]